MKACSVREAVLLEQHSLQRQRAGMSTSCAKARLYVHQFAPTPKFQWRTCAIATADTLTMVVQKQKVERSSREFSCLAVGDPVTDIVAKVSENSIEGLVGNDVGGCALIDGTELAQLRSTLALEATETIEVPGGSAANVVACIASLSPAANCHFAGSIGADATGSSYSTHLKSAAVQPHFVRSDVDPSAVSVCLVTPDGQRTMRTCLGAASTYEKEHLPAAEMQTMHLLHCEGYTAYKSGVLDAVAEAANTGGALFSLDMASFEVIRNCWDSLRPIIESRKVNVVFCNEDEAGEIVSQYGKQDENQQQSLEQLVECAGNLLAPYCRVVVFTLGAKGAVAMSDGKTARSSASKVPVADTVGAGDAFCGAFLSAYIQGADLQACVEMGCAAGAEAVQCHGARLAKPSIHRLQGKLNSLMGKL